MQRPLMQLSSAQGFPSHLDYAVATDTKPRKLIRQHVKEL